MAAPVAQLFGGIRDGKELKTAAGVTTLRPGMLVKLDSSGSAASLASSTDVYGIALGNRYSIYRPTSEVFGADEPFTTVWGLGEALLSADFFTGGSLPPIPGQALYAGASGLWHVTGTKQVGQLRQIVSRLEPVGGIGTSQNLALIRFDIRPGT